MMAMTLPVTTGGNSRSSRPTSGAATMAKMPDPITAP